MISKYIPLALVVASASAFLAPMNINNGAAVSRTARPSSAISMGYDVDLTGKVAFVAGVADSGGYGWAMCKALAEAGATVTVGTWPPALNIFSKQLERGSFDEDSILADGSKMKIDKIYPLDAVYDTPEGVPEDVKSNKRYAGLDGFTISECAEKIKADYGKVDILIHSLANGPEVTKPLMETSRAGYLAASSASAYSLVSMVQHFAPIMPEGSSVCSMTYIASTQNVPGYGGGMSSAKAQLESDTRVLAMEAGRKHKIRVNTISAGPLKSRAATAISAKGEKSFIEFAIDYSKENSPLKKDLFAEEVGKACLFLCSDLGSAVTGQILYVDNGLNTMHYAYDSASLSDSQISGM
uniref:Enoyl-[acyl-carrier-protein] reductase (NADH) n=1 Tax=Fibrocapsa japonica TaxID=94617 RepID=A0A7S2UUD7_9STRA|mmetsp:Transcript_13847/g.20404  ORF Transcript_13847/g.20404 Transcript_13847/m.20404 type:complete len:354 (+) Transcript_13847:128-1189(+)|eukprot:CAMPEP_0113935806 /NCGR_PEP_ID=MMETSP1339-20121228/2876_1 /TAXON_ID=94617 /ORGANISM="Fibrocapsa japonica" /LENGTH=353 /DNA_ID=CAMNT_0000938075 /DNA_START=121 /DNA_END=1182 /DNA_ORIENTATION=+ /assembly_acc=CAM_ASM_000762